MLRVVEEDAIVGRSTRLCFTGVVVLISRPIIKGGGSDIIDAVEVETGKTAFNLG